MPTDKLYKLLTRAEDFFSYWEKEIICEDNRSMYTKGSPFMATVIGIKNDAILLRRNNLITDWYSLKDTRISFFVDEH